MNMVSLFIKRRSNITTKRKKIALCLFGYPKGSTRSRSGAYENRFKHLFEQVIIHNPDIFIHCWDPSKEDELNDLFKPKLFSYENQIGFDKKIKAIDASRFKSNYPNQQDPFKTFSFFNTRNKSNKLKMIYEEEMGFTYDCVITARFDVGYHTGGKNKTSYIKFDPKYDMSFIHSAYWDQLNAGPSDHWFYGNSKDINTICQIEDKIVDYLKKGSEYCNNMINGWIDSNATNLFSNEILIQNKNKNHRKHLEWQCLNNHNLYKWHFYKNNFWNLNKCKFINQELWK